MFKQHLEMIGRNETPSKKAKFWQSYVRSLKGNSNKNVNFFLSLKRWCWHNCCFCLFSSKDRTTSVLMIHQKCHLGDHWALTCHCAASMMSRAQHPKELLVLVTVTCQFIAKHTVIHHDQSIRTTMADPVSYRLQNQQFHSYTQFTICCLYMQYLLTLFSYYFNYKQIVNVCLLFKMHFLLCVYVFPLINFEANEFIFAENKVFIASISWSFLVWINLNPIWTPFYVCFLTQ